ncbi:hypothetical protein SMITH_562 [Smithella sp. ME-1]|uniref:Uncharacterized protein n=1 Tax=hydrocarbon metagenome TaxID=938273 RepID=A0A0W8FR07_9ZZZZ|nr:hypothetical protein SMITH_562 [Smithella sp. ME-1]
MITRLFGSSGQKIKKKHFHVLHQVTRQLSFQMLLKQWEMQR